MTDVPSEYALAPDEWKNRVLELCDALAEDIAAILDANHEPEAAADALQSLFRPYLTDEPPSSASQLWAEANEGRLRAGDIHANPVTLTCDESVGRWRSIHDDTPADEEAGTTHRRLADAIVETVWFGDPDIRRQTIRRMEPDRELVADYLEPLHELEAETGGSPTAAVCRDLLAGLLERFAVRVEKPSGDLLRRGSLRVTDRSERDDLTHFTVGTPDHDAGAVLAADPGKPHAVDRLADRADIDPSQVLFTTDHHRFDFSSQLPADYADLRLPDPSARDESAEDFHRAVREVREAIGQVLVATAER
jgi:hypothetical protein